MFVNFNYVMNSELYSDLYDNGRVHIDFIDMSMYEKHIKKVIRLHPEHKDMSPEDSIYTYEGVCAYYEIRAAIRELRSIIGTIKKQRDALVSYGGSVANAIKERENAVYDYTVELHKVQCACALFAFMSTTDDESSLCENV